MSIIHAERSVMAHELDSFDRRLLREIQRDSSRPVTQLAEVVGLSQAPCWRRLQRLRELGYIKSEVALLDRKRLGWELELFIHIKLNAHGRTHVTEFTEAMRAHEQVLNCYILLGNVDLMLHMVVRDIADYERFFFDHLSQSPGMQEATTMTVVTEVKRSTALPV